MGTAVQRKAAPLCSRHRRHQHHVDCCRRFRDALQRVATVHALNQDEDLKDVQGKRVPGASVGGRSTCGWLLNLIQTYPQTIRNASHHYIKRETDEGSQETDQVEGKRHRTRRRRAATKNSECGKRTSSVERDMCHGSICATPRSVSSIQKCLRSSLVGFCRTVVLHPPPHPVHCV